MSELTEVLESIEWREHRRVRIPENLPRVKEELIDVFKYWLSMVQLFDMTPGEVISEYWKKSAVVRQRFSEEYMKTLDGPTVVVDIDEVLCDFSNGFLMWLLEQKLVPEDRAADLLNKRRYINAESLGVPRQEWSEIKHNFRTSGAIRKLLKMPGAWGFLQNCEQAGFRIVLLTSRPIDAYPNLMSDTVAWLAENSMRYDFIWWSLKKAEKLVERRLHDNVVFAVDDDIRYVKQFDAAGINTFWYRPNKDWDRTATEILSNTQFVSTLEEIPLAKLGEKYAGR